jgi:hypothetical protein
MGEDFNRQKNIKNQRLEFKNRVLEETKVLADWLQQQRFEKNQCCFGYESEAWLIDSNALPAPKNQEFLAKLGDPSVVTELAKFNFEVNGDIFRLSPDLFEQIHSEMKTKDAQIRQCADSFGLRPVWVGILPTVRDDMLNPNNISDKNRYYELAHEILRLRKNKPIRIKIDRFDDIDLERTDIMSESAATSLQIHTQVNPENSVQMFNSAQLISAPLLAICANSPFLFGKKLWDETRIPVFEQTIAFKDANKDVADDPVSFGFSYLKNSFLDLFQENIDRYPIILPVLFDDEPDKLRHLKFLNGQIWRWNRPIVGTGSTPHLRLEHRAIPAGPSVTDMVANIAFYTGLLFYYAKAEAQWTHQVSFEEIKSNFYQCAKLGLKAKVNWPGHVEPVNVQTLLHKTLVDQSVEGLKSIGVGTDSIHYYINEVIKNRIQSGWTGAAWQKSYIDTHGFDFQAMTNEYVDRQVSMEPVHKWKI